MLINRQYFNGELSINYSQTPIQQRLDAFIEKYEPELLKDIMGYELYKAFINGIQAVTVEERWTNLIAGAEYLQGSILYKWDGLVTVPASVVSITYASNATTIVVGRGQTYDPVAGDSSTIIPDALVGKYFTFEQRSYGQLRADEYSVSGNVLTLLNGAVFSNNDTFFYKTSPIQFATATTTGQKSLIANYVYYMYMRDQATQTTQVGEVATKTENATRVSPAQKMTNAWNEMAGQIQALWHYLDNNKTTYPEWSWCARRWMDYRTINTFNL